MKKQIFLGVVVAACVVILMSFFMPWAKVNVSAVGVSKELEASAAGTPFASKWVGSLKKATSALGDIGDIKIKTMVTGYSIPTMINQKKSKVAISLMQIMFKSVENLDIKSYLVYLLPIFAIICAILAVLGQKMKLYIIAMLVISGTIAIAGLYNLLTMNVSSVAVKITIGKGLWLTMYSFLIICLTSAVWLIQDKKS